MNCRPGAWGLRGYGVNRLPWAPRQSRPSPIVGRPHHRRGEFVVIREAASTNERDPPLPASSGSRADSVKSNGASVNDGNGTGAAGVHPATESLYMSEGLSSNGVGGANSRVVSQNGVSASAKEGSTTQEGGNTVPSRSNGTDPQLKDETVSDRQPGDGSSFRKEAHTEEIGTPYDSPGGRWSQMKRYSTWRRTVHIWSFALVFAFKYWRVNRQARKLSAEEVSKRKRELAIWLRKGLVRLGPTFIKIGQQFSTRVDVLSPEFVQELEQLQDRVPAFDSQLARETIERNCGKPVEQLFEAFDDTPIAAASLGQVHLARLRGEQVVVKVQRPRLRELFEIDLKNIRALAQWVQSMDPMADGAARDWVAIHDECARILYEEIDYRLEAENAALFRSNFSGTSWVKVPEVYTRFTSEETLVMEYCPGVKVNNAQAIDELGLDRKRLARLSVESYLQQILRHGFFHADPHPGNVAVDAAEGGRLIYYDFGMMGRIRSNVRKGLLDLFYGVYLKEPDRCIDALVQMGVLVAGGDRTAIRRTAEFFIRTFEERLAEQRREREQDPESQKEFKAQMTKEEYKVKRKQILAAIGEDLLVTAADQPFRFPAAFTFVVRSFTVLDGIGKSLDPRFDISEIAAPYARELLLEARPQFSKIQDDVVKRFANQNRAVANLFKAPNSIEDIGAAVRQLERGDLKLRVRALEVERALARMALSQQFLAFLVLACAVLNTATMLHAMGQALVARCCFGLAAVLAGFAASKFLKLRKEEALELEVTGTS